jgi:NAD(P)-dependent dehydrogenase (short-subunit alcohol dehydrogenase family)
MSIPTTFLTAYYGLYRLANMKAGDRVLIHAAAGGVGLAAVQLALQAGAEIFGTAGSNEKREYLKSLGVHHILNSRTLDFADEIMAITEGQGVNIVLNSLAGEFIPKSLSVLADGGCFLEIGKQGVWSQEQVAELNPTLSSYVYDLAQILYTELGIIQTDLLALLAEAELGNIQPLPIETFPMQSVIEAFRHMAQAKHIGKVVITQELDENAGSVRGDASYLITGGLGGLGLKVAQRLVENGARHLILVGRSAPSDSTQQTLDDLKQAGVEVMVVQGDISQNADVTRILEAAQQTMPLLRGIIHAAGIIDDAMLPQQNWGRFERVLAPKISGAWNLHQLTESLPLDFFVMFSSAASVMGSPGQANYAAGNAFMDALAIHRRASGLPGLSINWGAWSEVGMASAMDAQQQKRIAAQGLSPIAPQQGLAVLEQLMAENTAQVVVLPVNWSKLLNQRDSIPPLLEGFKQQVQGSSQTAAESDFLEQLALTPVDERYNVLQAFVREQVIKVLGLSAAQAPGLNQGLIEIGMDSLMAVELSNRFRANFRQSFPATLAFEQSTIQALTNYLNETVVSQLFDKSSENGASAADDVDVQNADASQLLSNLDNLSDEQVDILLQQMQADQRGNI